MSMNPHFIPHCPVEICWTNPDRKPSIYTGRDLDFSAEGLWLRISDTQFFFPWHTITEINQYQGWDAEGKAAETTEETTENKTETETVSGIESIQQGTPSSDGK